MYEHSDIVVPPGTTSDTYGIKQPEDNEQCQSTPTTLLQFSLRVKHLLHSTANLIISNRTSFKA